MEEVYTHKFLERQEVKAYFLKSIDVYVKKRSIKLNIKKKKNITVYKHVTPHNKMIFIVLSVPLFS